MENIININTDRRVTQIPTYKLYYTNTTLAVNTYKSRILQILFKIISLLKRTCDQYLSIFKTIIINVLNNMIAILRLL